MCFLECLGYAFVILILLLINPYESGIKDHKPKPQPHFNNAENEMIWTKTEARSFDKHWNNIHSLTGTTIFSQYSGYDALTSFPQSR